MRVGSVCLDTRLERWAVNSITFKCDWSMPQGRILYRRKVLLVKTR